MRKSGTFMRILSGILCLSLASCSSASNDSAETGRTESAAEKSVFRLYYTSELQNLNYLKTNNWNDTSISANIIDCLVDYDRYGNIIPGLAESWTHNDDMSEWTFNLRHGIKWVDYNGNEIAEVKADDWVAAAEYVNNAVNESTCQYMYCTGSIVHNAQEYYDYTEYMMKSANGTKTEDAEGNPLTPADEVKPEDIGVKALDDYTLVFTLDQPCSFFLSVLSYPSYMPVNREFLAEAGDMFGRDNKNLLYNGAYILSYYQPQEKHVLTKNESYWDRDNVHIDTVQREYNPDAYYVQASMFLNGQVDYAQINADQLDIWLNDEETKNLVHPLRMDTSFSYFYTFNFDPEFDERYEPDNWRIAVNNENFRHAVAASLDRISLAAIYEPYQPENMVINTITPKEFTAAEGLDYTNYEPLREIMNRDSYDLKAAEEYREKAREELEAQGATFPIKVLTPYNPAVVDWYHEAQLVEKQLEDSLGEDFIDIIVEAGPETGFLSSVRRSGKYAFMKCNWGADYTDPLTWTEPFVRGRDYNFWDTSEDENTQKIFTQWEEKVKKAAAVYDNDYERYTIFAEAEELLINHAIAIPCLVSFDDGYVASKLNIFEGEYASNGIAIQRFKLFHLNETSMSMEEHAEAYEQWQKEREESIKNYQY